MRGRRAFGTRWNAAPSRAWRAKFLQQVGEWVQDVRRNRGILFFWLIFRQLIYIHRSFVVYHSGMWSATLHNLCNHSLLDICLRATSKCCGWSSNSDIQESRNFGIIISEGKSLLPVLFHCPTSTPRHHRIDHSTSRYLTFWRRYRSVWANILRFVPQSSHATCDDCLDCKMKFKRAMEPRRWFYRNIQGSCLTIGSTCHHLFQKIQDAQAKYEVARLYKSHLDAVGADRQLEEFLQARSYT